MASIYRTINKLFFLTLCFLHLGIQSAFAITGNLGSISETKISYNWPTQNPKIVVALGLLQQEFVENYIELANGILAGARPDAEIEIIPQARTSSIVQSLQDPNTVGFVFISHTYTTNLDTAVLLGADLSPLPNEILSAATPALRFAAFMGCHGKSVIKHYQVKYEVSKLPGRQTVFFTTAPFVTGKGLFGLFSGGIEDAFHNLADQMQYFDFGVGVEPPTENEGTLAIEAKDIVGGIESRVVLVNNKIVGTLGAVPEFLPNKLDYKTYKFNVPSYAFKENKKQRVTIRSSELSRGAPADDYLIQSVYLENEIGDVWKKSYDVPMHLGDDAFPYQGPVLIAPSSLSTPEDFQYAAKYLKYKEWVDCRADIWPKNFKRFYIDKLSSR